MTRPEINPCIRIAFTDAQPQRGIEISFPAPALGAVCALALGAGTAHVVPARPDTVTTVHQPDGSKLERRLWGDEHAHGYETLDGHIVVYDARDRTFEFAARAASGAIPPGPPWSTAPAGAPRRLERGGRHFPTDDFDGIDTNDTSRGFETPTE